MELENGTFTRKEIVKMKDAYEIAVARDIGEDLADTYPTRTFDQIQHLAREYTFWPGDNYLSDAKERFEDRKKEI
jgi:hypothetical protein